MSIKNRIPNRLKFRMVYSDRSLIEGTVKCSDEQHHTIMRTLFPNKGEDQGLEQAFAATGVHQHGK